MQSCKKIGEVQAAIMKVDELVKRYDDMAGTTNRLPDDLVVTVMIGICCKDLREHLELSTKDMKLVEVREEIMNYVERKPVAHFKFAQSQDQFTESIT